VIGVKQEKIRVSNFPSDANCVDVLPAPPLASTSQLQFKSDFIESGSLEDYVKNMQVEKEILDLTGQSEINEDLLDANAIPPERESLWRDQDEEDPDCQIIEDPWPEMPQLSPPLEEAGIDDAEPTAQPTKMEALLISPITLRKL